MIPEWFHLLAIASLIAGFACAIIIALDEIVDPQHMWIMNVVWPVTALFAGFFALFAYFANGKLAAKSSVQPAMERGEEMPNRKHTQFPVMVGKGGYTLRERVHAGRHLCRMAGLRASRHRHLARLENDPPGEGLRGVWILDYILALLFGIAFQYFTIKPMRRLSPGPGLVQAAKADVLSLTAWQVGMYGFMAVAHFWIFARLLDTKLHVNSVEFWFMMQIAMWFGFATSIR